MSIQLGGLELDTVTRAGVLTLELVGQADLRDSAPLSTALLDFHRRALAGANPQVKIDFRQVDFMNSTALGAFVRWMSELLKLAIEKRYQVVFEGTRERRWQRVSLQALASFAPENISVTFG